MGLFSKKRPKHDATVVWEANTSAPSIVCSCGWEWQYHGMSQDMTGNETRLWGDELYRRLEEHERTGQ